MKSIFLSFALFFAASSGFAVDTYKTQEMVVYRQPHDTMFSMSLTVRNGSAKKTLYEYHMWHYLRTNLTSERYGGRMFHLGAMTKDLSFTVPYEIMRDVSDSSSDRYFQLHLEQIYCTVSDQIVVAEISGGGMMDPQRESYKSVLLDFNQDKKITLKVIVKDSGSN